jgi:hypothetical protein
LSLTKLPEAAILECLKPAKARRINVIFKFYMNPISLDCWLYENSFISDYLYHKFAWNSYHFHLILGNLFCIKSKVKLYINPYLRIIENGYIPVTENLYWFLFFIEWNSKLFFILNFETEKQLLRQYFDAKILFIFMYFHFRYGKKRFIFDQNEVNTEKKHILWVIGEYLLIRISVMLFLYLNPKWISRVVKDQRL